MTDRKRRTEPPRIAVLGIGQWGANIIRELVGLAVTVVAVDSDPGARRHAAELGASHVAAQLDSDLDIDGIIVSTPASRHERDVIDAATFGVPVACEKPLAVTTASAQRMVDALGDRLTVLHVWRYHPGVELLGEIARAGRLGDINAIHTVRTNWTSPRTDVDPVWTLLPHDLSIAVEILGTVPQPTNATVERIDGRAVGIWATFGTSPSLVTYASTRGDRCRDVTVHGTHGVALLSDGATHIRLLSGSGSTPCEQLIAFDPTPALTRELDAFAHHVSGGERPKTAGDEGLAIVTAVEHALALGTPPSR